MFKLQSPRWGKIQARKKPKNPILTEALQTERGGLTNTGKVMSWRMTLTVRRLRHRGLCGRHRRRITDLQFSNSTTSSWCWLWGLTGLKKDSWWPLTILTILFPRRQFSGISDKTKCWQTNSGRLGLARWWPRKIVEQAHWSAKNREWGSEERK